MRILLTGATGLIGRPLCRDLMRAGHQPLVVSRRPEGASIVPGVEIKRWDPEAGPLPAELLAGVEGVIHLAGEPIATARWSEEQKRRIRDSRVNGTRNLIEGLRQATVRPKALISASAVGYYGDRGEEWLDERASPGQGFLSEICLEWEREAMRGVELGLRVAMVRIGVVLSRDGGAIPKMLPAFKLGLAGNLGSGRQYFPWIHIEDVTGLFRHALESDSLSGPINAVAPGIVTNAEFTRELARAVHRPTFLPVPALALKLLFGEMAAVLLASQRVKPSVALETGYRFHHPELKGALADLFSERDRAARAG